MKEFRNPKLAVDAVVLDAEKGILLVKRKSEPHKGRWALPGGFVSYGEEPQDATAREAKEETGLEIELLDKRKAWVFGSAERDSRGHTVALVFMGSTDASSKPEAGGDAEDARFFSEDEYPDIKRELAFDHSRIIEEVLGW